jgi:hypothetical protein
VSLTQPTQGASYASGSPIAIKAAASDGDGSIVKVEFLAGSTKIGEALAAPYDFTWLNAPLGTSSLTAVATDDRGGQATSAPVSVSVVAPGAVTTVTLQRGTPGAAVSDLYLSSYHKTDNFGAIYELIDQQSLYTPMVRFAIFQSEGGPIPNTARITSAVLSVYKYSEYQATYGVHRVLQDWSETSATWAQRLPGVAWKTAGANGAGFDYTAVADASLSVGYDPGWLDFNVTNAVNAMKSQQPSANFGWRLKATSGVGSLKRFYTSDFAASPALRPKLVVTYEQ